MSYCDIYGNVASSFGDEIAQNKNLDEAFMNVKTSTAVAISGLSV